MVDFATIVPTALANSFFRHSVDYYDINSAADWVNYIVHGAYTLRILRALRLHRKLVYFTDEVDRFLYSMLLSVVTMVLFGEDLSLSLDASWPHSPPPPSLS
jgi:hypothetical protein